jgi:hypothetical protein
VQAHHAEIGAQVAQEAGCSARTVELIRHHEDEAEPAGSADSRMDRLLAALQAADSEN